MAQVYEVEEGSDCFVVMERDRGYGESVVCVCLSEDKANAIVATRSDWRIEASSLLGRFSTPRSKSHNFGN